MNAPIIPCLQVRLKEYEGALREYKKENGKFFEMKVRRGLLACCRTVKLWGTSAPLAKERSHSPGSRFFVPWPQERYKATIAGLEREVQVGGPVGKVWVRCCGAHSTPKRVLPGVR